MFGFVRAHRHSLGSARCILVAAFCAILSIFDLSAQAQAPQPGAPTLPAAQVPGGAAIDPDQSAPPSANPLTLRRFDSASFEAAQKAQRMVLLVFTSVDSPTCRIQVPTLTRVLAEAEFRGIEVYQVDLASQRDVVQKFGTPSASTMISFRGSREIVRSQGMVKPSAMRRHLRLTL
ncbi:MAG TPA: thioredoxin family protein [Pseudobdellovibrionaceae bacterium]|nr:thioredoxin family protein [Pseudobdellovibrionaceae bacterium]